MLTATDELIALDRELDLAARGETPQQCPRCDGWTYDEMCLCTPGVFVDPVQQLIAEKGDTITDADFDRVWAATGSGGAEPGEEARKRDREDGAGNGDENLHSRLFGRRG